jgi:hypothetical protein
MRHTMVIRRWMQIPWNRARATRSTCR